MVDTKQALTRYHFLQYRLKSVPTYAICANLLGNCLRKWLNWLRAVALNTLKFIVGRLHKFIVQGHDFLQVVHCSVDRSLISIVPDGAVSVS